MFKIRFFISVAIYAAVSIMMPFFIPLPMKMYLILMGVFTVGYLAPSVLSVRRELAMAVVVWFAGASLSLLLYDYVKSQTDANHAFMQNWKKFYSTGLFILMGLQLYARFTSELVFKQLTKK